MTMEQQEIVRNLADFFLGFYEQDKGGAELEKARGKRELEGLILEQIDTAIQKRMLAHKFLTENVKEIQFLRTQIIMRKVG